LPVALLLAWLPESPLVLLFEALELEEASEALELEVFSELLELDDSPELPLPPPFPLLLSLLAEAVAEAPSDFTEAESDLSEAE
jgi:hypothetical protein